MNYLFKCLIFTVIFLIAASDSVFAYGNHNYTDEEISALTNAEMSSVTSTIPTSHPRIFVKSGELEALKARVGIGAASDYDLNALRWQGQQVQFGELSSQYQVLRDMVQNYRSDPEGLWSAVDNNKKTKLIGWTAVAYAFINLLEPDDAYVVSAKYILDKVVNDPQVIQGSAGGEQVWPVAIAYDWLSSYLSDSEKNKYIMYMLDQVEMFGFVGGSGGHFPKLYDLTNLNPATGLRSLFVGFAIYNDLTANNAINANNQESYKIIREYGGFFKRIVDGFKMVGGETGGYFEDYGHAYMSLENTLLLVELWYQATGENLYQGFNTLRYRPYLNYHVAKPNGTAIFSNYVKFNNYKVKGEYELIANRYNDSTIQTMAAQDFKLLNNGYIWKEVLWKNPELNENADLQNTLSKAAHFDPTGWSFVRSGWAMGSTSNPSDEFWASIFSGRYFFTHKWYMMNSFAIFYRGDLIVNDAKDRTSTKYHNTIMLDNDDQIEDSGNLSGPDNIIGWKNYDANTKADLSKITKYEHTGMYNYSLAEAHNIYSASKLDFWTREFVYLQPYTGRHYYITYDRITTDSASVVKKNMINTFNSPKVNGSTASNGSTYQNTNIIQVDNGGEPGQFKDGRALVKVLYPVQHNMSVEYISANQNLNAYKARPRWGMFITPKNTAREDKFMNLFLVTDSTTNNMPTTTRMSHSDGNVLLGNVNGLHVKDSTLNAVVMFSSEHNTDSLTGNIVYTISPTADGKHYLFGLQPSTSYSVDIVTSGSTQTITVSAGNTYTTTSEGTLAFNVDSAGIVITDTISPQAPTWSIGN